MTKDEDAILDLKTSDQSIDEPKSSCSNRQGLNEGMLLCIGSKFTIAKVVS